MSELVRQTLDDIMQLAAEDLSLGNDSLDSVSVWAEIAEEYGML